MTSDDSQELRLDLPAAHSASRMARQIVSKFALERGLDEDEIGTLELVTSELLSNAVDHGGGDCAMEESDLKGDVRMQLWLRVVSTSWTLSVSDQGGGDPQEMEPFLDKNDLPDLEDERGRGFFLLSSMVDVMAVRLTENGRGLVLTAEKRHVADG